MNKKEEKTTKYRNIPFLFSEEEVNLYKEKDKIKEDN